MAKSQQTFNKKAREEKRLKKRKDKAARREERKAASPGGGLENMLAYVDENGMITDVPVDPSKKIKINAADIETSVPKKAKEAEADPIKEGKVAFFNHSKGFGFIHESITQEKYFMHINGIIDSVVEGDKVSFELERGLRGMNAVNVRKLS